MQKTIQENPMKNISIEKITLNCGTAGPGDKLEKSLKLLQKISGMKAVSTKTTKRIPTWGVRPGLELGCRVTIRGKKAVQLMQAFFAGKKNQIKASCFDDNGNFAFGFHEYLDIPSIEYSHEIGIIGFEVAVTLQRKGFRIRRRAVQKKKIPAKHKITKEDAMAYITKEYGVNVI